MKKLTLFVLLTIFVLTACGSPTTTAFNPTLPPSTVTLPPAPTNTLIPPPTETPLRPTETLEPTLIPTPTLTPVPPCNVDTRPSDDSVIFYINDNYTTAVCLPNGNKLVLAYEIKHPTKISAYIVNPDGKLTIWEKPSQLMQQFASFLFASPDGNILYWESAVMCGNRECKTLYYASNLDDSGYKRIFANVNSAQNIYISPSGQYIVYLDNSFQQLRGCYIYDVEKNTSTRINPDNSKYGWATLGEDYCFGENHWSPKDDKLYAETKTGYSIMNVPDGKITSFSTKWVSWDDYYKSVGSN
jgi:hypothetical protein